MTGVERLGSLIVAVATALCLAPAVAVADSAKIGSSLQRPQTVFAFCATNGCVGVQRALATGPALLPLTAPVGGRVTSWSVRSGDDGAIYALRILRPAGETSYAGSGTAFATSVVPTGPDVVVSSPTSLPIAAGDAIGLMLGVGTGGFPTFSSTGIGPTDEVGYSPAFADGSTASFFEGAPYELLVQATITYCRVPAVRGKKASAAKALIRGADCTPRTIKKLTKKKRKRGKVLSQQIPPGTTADPGTEVTVVVGKGPKRKS